MMVSLALHFSEIKLSLTNITYFPLLPSPQNVVTGELTSIGRLNIFNGDFLFPPSCPAYMFAPAGPSVTLLEADHP